MKVFVTGATGYIGTAVVEELVKNGHEVLGFATKKSGIEKLNYLGAKGVVGDLSDTSLLSNLALEADGVIHLAFNHNFRHFEQSLEIDLKVIEAIGQALVGTNKIFITTAHNNGMKSDKAVMNFGKQGVRASIVSLSPSVHSAIDKGFITTLINIAKEKGVSAYIEDGSNCWSAIHRLDAAVLYRMALENAPSCSYLDGVGDEAISFRDIAKIIGKYLNIPVISIEKKEAVNHFGFVGMIASMDIPRNSLKTQKLLGWKPIQVGLIEDMINNYFD